MKKLLGIFGLLVTLWLFLAINTADPWYNLLESNFLRPNNVENLLRRTAMYGLLGIGVAFVIIHGGIDLSIGSVVCLSAALLAVFLRVDYQPFESLEVVEVKAQQQVVRVADKDALIAPEERLFYSGGSRARKALLTVREVDQKQEGMLTVRVEGILSHDDDSGRLHRTHEIEHYTPRRSDVSASVTLATKLSELEDGDRLQLVHPAHGEIVLGLEQVMVGDRATQLLLTGDLPATFSTQWLAIPLERRQRMPILVAVGAVLAIGLLLGMSHGLLITGLKLPSFVVTLCGLLIYRGVSRFLVADQPVGFLTEYDTTLRPLATGRLVIWQELDQADRIVNSFGIPHPFFIFIGVAILAALLLNQTIWGRYLFALGNNEDAARYSGINTSRVVVGAYMLCTLLAVLGGILFGLDANSVSPSSFGNFFELYAIAAAVLGGCSLRGGEGSILGVIIGTAVMQTLNNMIVLMKISDTLEFTIIGMVILAGVIADELFKKISARRRALAQAKTVAAE